VDTPDPVQVIPQPEVPLTPPVEPVEVNDGKIPLGGFLYDRGWSVVSMMLSIIALLIALFLLVALIRSRRKDDKLSETEEQTKRRRRFITLGMVTGILTPIVWLVLDNFYQEVVWINKWTIFVGISFIVHIIMYACYLRVTQSQRANQEKYQESQAQ